MGNVLEENTLKIKVRSRLLWVNRCDLTFCKSQSSLMKYMSNTFDILVKNKRVFYENDSFIDQAI